MSVYVITGVSKGIGVSPPCSKSFFLSAKPKE